MMKSLPAIGYNNTRFLLPQGWIDDKEAVEPTASFQIELSHISILVLAICSSL